MLRFRGTSRVLCDGLTRRDLLHVGSLAGLGVSLEKRARAAPVPSPRSADPSFGRAKSCILIFPYGSPPQHETFDPKPNAPREIQGELLAIPSSVPGVQVGEGIPRVAAIMDRLTVVRSVTHEFPVHGVAYAVTGIPTYTPDLEKAALDPRHWPFIGSIVDYLDEQRDETSPPIPRNIGLPWMLNSKTDILVNAGPFAAFLGRKYDPLWTDFDGPGLHLAPKYVESQGKQFLDPYGGTTPQGQFTLSSATRLTPDTSLERLGLRRSLLATLESARRNFDSLPPDAQYENSRGHAFSLLTDSKIHDALDVQREDSKIREAYGYTLFGQTCLAARRLIEAGGRFVTVFWDGFGAFANCAWDTHYNHYPRLKEYLLPGFDLAYPALIRDLEQRGLLDETLVLWLSEHGRTPQIDSKQQGAGRHHWSRVYSVALAGAGIPRGKVVGSSDRLGGDVADVPVSPKDILATALHLLGIDPDQHVHDALNRPYRLVGDGRVRRELLA